MDSTAPFGGPVLASRGGMQRAAMFLMASLAVAACAEESGDFDEVTAPDGDDGKTDAASELRVRAGDTTVWMTQKLVRRTGERGDEFVLRGRASREITDGNNYIFDDVYGEFGLRGPRSFEVFWVIRSNTQPLLDGGSEFTGLGFVPSGTRPPHLTARTIVRPRLDTFAGASSVYLTAEVTPVVYDRRVVYRVSGRVTGGLDAVTASRGVARVIDATHFVIDLTSADIDAIGGTATELTVTTTRGTATATKRARLGLAVKTLGLTSGDAYETWPPPTCTTETAACLAALPADAIDLGSCGEAIAVRACRR